jgi:hypothetical protein
MKPKLNQEIAEKTTVRKMRLTIKPTRLKGLVKSSENVIGLFAESRPKSFFFNSKLGKADNNVSVIKSMPATLPETVLFDLDGTLVDNFEAIHQCYNDVMKLMRLPEVSYDQIRRAVGGSVNITVLKLAGEENAGVATKLFREHFPSVMLNGLKIYPGCLEILEGLKAQGIRTAIYTNKDDTNSKKIINHLKLDHLVDGVFGTNVHPWRKPQTEFTHLRH